jgi:polyisoprenoid-binding protein YceI
MQPDEATMISRSSRRWTISSRVVTRLAVLALGAMPSTAQTQSGTRAGRSAPTAVFQLVPAESQVSYAVNEVFLEEDNRLFTAVGTAAGVSGEIVFDLEQPHRSAVRRIVVDLRQLTSDSERRDRALRERFLESRRHPYARLDSASVSGLPGAIPQGQRFTFQLVGDLTVHGVARRTQWRGEATLMGDTLRGQATTRVAMTAFDIEVPRFLWLRVADAVKLDITFVAVRAQPGPDVPNARHPTPSRGGLP